MLKCSSDRRAKRMERNKKQIPGIIQTGCKGTYREDVPEHSTGENDGVGGQKEKEAPTGMFSLREGGNYQQKSIYPMKRLVRF